MHLVYIVRPGGNEELRYSLRSAWANLPVESVTIVGDPPGWVTGARVIPGNRFDSKPRNVLDNVRIAVNDPDVPEQIVLMNDDFFVLEPHDTIPVLYRGLLVDQIERLRNRTWWSTSLRATLTWLQEQGYPDPLSYELHVPFPVEKSAMRAALDRLGDYEAVNPPQWRTVYGNLARIGGQSHRDAKAKQPGQPVRRGPFLSTDDGAFYLDHWAWLASQFPDPSPFEARLARAAREDIPVGLYKNVTTGMIVEDTTGRLDKLARWVRVPADELAAPAVAVDPAEVILADGSPAPTDAHSIPILNGDPEVVGEADAEPDAEPEPEKPKRASRPRAKKEA